MDTPINCRVCGEFKKIYVDQLCYGCSMVEDPENPRAARDEATNEAGIEQAISLATKGYAPVPRTGCFIIEENHLAEIWLQMRHLTEQLDEAIRGRNFDKLNHCEASLQRLAALLPGGAR